MERGNVFRFALAAAVIATTLFAGKVTSSGIPVKADYDKMLKFLEFYKRETNGDLWLTNDKQALPGFRPSARLQITYAHISQQNKSPWRVAATYTTTSEHSSTDYGYGPREKFPAEVQSPSSEVRVEGAIEISGGVGKWVVQLDPKGGDTKVTVVDDYGTETVVAHGSPDEQNLALAPTPPPDKTVEMSEASRNLLQSFVNQATHHTTLSGSDPTGFTVSDKMTARGFSKKGRWENWQFLASNKIEVVAAYPTEKGTESLRSNVYPKPLTLPDVELRVKVAAIVKVIVPRQKYEVALTEKEVREVSVTYWPKNEGERTRRISKPPAELTKDVAAYDELVKDTTTQLKKSLEHSLALWQ